MKKVGILNIQWTNNYGAVLLAYALQECIKQLGYEVEIIDYCPVTTEKKRTFAQKLKQHLDAKGVIGTTELLIRKLVSQDNEKNVNFSTEKKKTNFNKFRENYLKRSKTYHIIPQKNNLNYDVYVVGSDVVWKPDRIRSEESKIYFLDFTINKQCRRISYAASIGTDDDVLLSELTSSIREKLEKFDAVSVREETTATYIQQVTDKEVECCIDPTFLLKSSDYDKLLPFNIEGEEQYIYMYLFEDNDEAYQLVNWLSDKLQMKVVCQCGQPAKVKNLAKLSQDDGPLEFVARIRDAAFIVTDSFHGTAFSIIYEKKFITVSRGDISIRMQDLLKRLNISDRFVTQSVAAKTIVDVEINYNEINQIIDSWAKGSIDYLSHAMGGGEM